jgi:DNA-binding MarR family transcriptional regulator
MTLEYQIDQSFGYGISMVYALMKSELEARFKAQGYDITVPQWIILNRLWEHNGVSQSDLVSVTQKDKTNIARLVARLESRELVTRRRSGEDSRQQEVYLTEAGRKLEDEMKPIAAQMLVDVLQGIPVEKIETAREVLWQVTHNLTEMEST